MQTLSLQASRPAASGVFSPPPQDDTAGSSADVGTSSVLMSAEFDSAFLAAHQRNDLNACHDLYHAFAAALVQRGCCA